MKNSSSVLLLLSALIISCTDISDSPDSDSLTEIRLSSGIELHSKAAYPQTDIQISEGEQVHVWVDRNIDLYPELYGQTMTADGSGNLAGDYKMYFPMNGDNVNIYALHTNAYFPDTDFPVATFTHSVQKVQTNLEQYVDSDLLYARSKDIARTENTVPLRFYHQLAKLQVAIVAKDGIRQSDIAEVTVNGTRVLANVSLTKDTNPNALTIVPAGNPAAISIGTDLSADFSDENIRYNDVIIVPQRVAAGTVFLGITLKGGTNVTYKLDSDTVFEGGKKYTLQMTVDMKSIELNTVVSDWLEGDPIIGNTGTVRYIVNYTDNTSERIAVDKGGSITFNGAGKTVRSIELPDYGKTYLIGRKDMTGIELNIDAGGNLSFRPSEDGYTPIGSYAEMQLINTLDGAMAGYYRQEADLDLMNESWNPIGSEEKPFTGVFDGNGFEISRINVLEETGVYAGLFGYMKGNQALLKDIDLVSGVVEGNKYAAGICAYNNGGTVSDCRNSCMIQSSIYSGGVVAYMDRGKVLNCCNTANILSSGNMRNICSGGGIAGRVGNGGEIIACYNIGAVSCENYYYQSPEASSYSGGISGLMEQNGTITACYNIGNIYSYTSYYFSSSWSYSCSSGVAGYVSSGGKITACYNAGRITAENIESARGEYVYGIAYASDSNCNISSCYWLEDMSEDGGVSGGVQTDVVKFTGTFTPDAEKYPEWGLGNGETNGWWKNYNGNNNLPQLWWE